MSDEFLQRMGGPFRGVLQWNELDSLWAAVREAPQGWYISLAGTQPAVEPASPADLQAFLTEIDTLLRKEHECNYCGIVFVDDPERPTFIKILDPSEVGGCGTGPVPPRWVLSRMRPSLIAHAAPLPGNRQRWWQKLFA